MRKGLSERNQRALLEAVKKASARMEAGMSPTEAAVKTAEDLRLPPALVQRVVHACNQGMATIQREGGRSVLEKVAEFPLARLEEVLARLYPSDVPPPREEATKRAVAAEYRRPPEPLATPRRTVKKASAAEDAARDPLVERIAEGRRQAEGVLKEAEASRRRWEEARREEAAACRSLESALDHVAAYFKQAAHARRPFAEVESNAVWRFGDPARRVLDYAYAAADLKEPRYADCGSCKRASRVQWNEDPYPRIAAVLEAAEQAVRAGIDCAKREKAAREARSRWLTRREAPVHEDAEPETDSLFKQSGLLSGTAGGAMGTTLAQKVQGSLAEQLKAITSQSPQEKAVQHALESLNDPDHLAELQRISTQAMLTDFLRNDEVISGYDPREVLDAYNEIAALSPRAASQPAVARSLLRRRLTAGAMEPFESHQLTAIEKNLREMPDDFSPGEDSARTTFTTR